MTEMDSNGGLDSPRIDSSGQPPPALGLAAPDSSSFVYALGHIELRYPSISVEKEVAQAIGRARTAGLTDHEALHAVLSSRANRYLVRQLCWVFVIEGLETYLLAAHDSSDLELLVESLRARPQPIDLDVVIGILGPLAPPEACNGLGLPIVAFDQIYSFDRDELLDAIIPRVSDATEDEGDTTPRVGDAIADEGDATADEGEWLRATAAELLNRILQIADNAGATDEHRALNYLVVRYPAIYAQTAAAHAENASLTAVDVRPSRLRGSRQVLDVIFSYTHRQTDVTEKYFVRVDVTEEFPFLVTKLSPYYDR